MKGVEEGLIRAALELVFGPGGKVQPGSDYHEEGEEPSEAEREWQR